MDNNFSIKYDAILIDVLNLFHRCIAGEEKEVNAIPKFLKSLNKIESNYLECSGKIYYLVDNPNSRNFSRKMIDPEYKLDREKLKPSFLRALDLLQTILLHRNNNYKLIQVPFLEADDLVPLVLAGIESDRKALLVSTDLDWSRAINKKTHWLDKDTIYDTQSFFDKYEFEPTNEKVCLWKALKGDESDCIPNALPNLQKETVLKILNQFSDIYSFLDSYKTLDWLNDHWKNEIKNNITRIRLNYQLVQFVNIDNPKILKEYEFDCTFEGQALFLFLKNIGITNVLEIDKRLKNCVITTISDDWAELSRY